MRLSEIIGHEHVRQTLVAAHVDGTSHHAYLFQGPDGVGKRQVAFGFAALMSCVGEGPEPRTDPCGVCRHCRRILAMAADPEASPHPDLLALRPDGKQIKVAQVREILRVVPFPPIEARFRVVIVHPADALGEEAANALLKTLEEPPSRTRFVLLTSRPAALLTTIRSRCQRVRFGRLTDAELTRVLEERHAMSPEQVARIVPVADGSVGAALALDGDPVMVAREELITRFLAIRPGDTLAAFEYAGLVAELGPGRDTVFELLERLLRDALMLRLGAGARLFHADLREPLQRWATRYGVDALMARLDTLSATRQGLAVFHTNPRLTLERLFLILTAPAGREVARVRLPHNEIL